METSAVPEKKNTTTSSMAVGRLLLYQTYFAIPLLRFHIETALNRLTVVEHHQLNDANEMPSAECVEIRVRSLPDELGESTKPTRHPV